MWPFLGPLVEDPNDPNTDYQEDPFTNPSSFTSHITPSVLSMIIDKGYDHVRLPVTPGPWMDAVRDEDESRISYLFSLFDIAITSCINAGLGVIIDLHDSYYVKNTPPELLAGGTSSPLWQRRIEVTRRFAERYSIHTPDKICLELFNEPLHPSSITGSWDDYLLSLYQVARTEMPNHTILCTAANYSSIDDLVAFDPTPYDENVLWVIHPYVPAIFTLQGYPYGTYNKYVYGLKWPPNPTDKNDAISTMTTNINNDTSLTSQEKTSLIASQTIELNYYFDVPLDNIWINGELNKITSWCNSHGISPSRIIANEYGVTRTNDGNNDDGFIGASEEDRIEYLNILGSLLDVKGFRRSIFALDAVDYGITDGEGSSIGTFIENLNL